MEKVERVRWTRARIWILMLFLVTTPIFANTQSLRRTIRAVWVENPPVIDGDLTDTVWQDADIATDFFRAKEGETYPAELDTEVRVLYDENTLYIGVRCEEPDMKSLPGNSNASGFPSLAKRLYRGDAGYVSRSAQLLHFRNQYARHTDR